MQREELNIGLGQRDRMRILSHTLPSGSFTLSWGQMRPQAPQSMQTEGSMRWRFLLFPVMASTGQMRLHTPQPTQRLVIS
jgi:hypothetical protein